MKVTPYFVYGNYLAVIFLPNECIKQYIFNCLDSLKFEANCFVEKTSVHRYTDITKLYHMV